MRSFIDNIGNFFQLIISLKIQKLPHFILNTHNSTQFTVQQKKLLR